MKRIKNNMNHGSKVHLSTIAGLSFLLHSCQGCKPLSLQGVIHISLLYENKPVCRIALLPPFERRLMKRLLCIVCLLLWASGCSELPNETWEGFRITKDCGIIKLEDVPKQKIGELEKAEFEYFIFIQHHSHSLLSIERKV